eukprot:9968044-Lingulodinium_polyedra.AAC.1
MLGRSAWRGVGRVCATGVVGAAGAAAALQRPAAGFAMPKKTTPPDPSVCDPASKRDAPGLIPEH